MKNPRYADDMMMIIVFARIERRIERWAHRPHTELSSPLRATISTAPDR
jgi:hypothetical protein